MSSDTFKVNEGYDSRRPSGTAEAAGDQPTYYIPGEGGSSGRGMAGSSRNLAVIGALVLVAVLAIVAIILAAIGLSKSPETKTEVKSTQCHGVQAYYLSGFHQKAFTGSEDQMKEIKADLNKKITERTKPKVAEYWMYNPTGVGIEVTKIIDAKPRLGVDGTIYYATILMEGPSLPTFRDLNGTLVKQSASASLFYNSVFLNLKSEPVNFAVMCDICDVEGTSEEQCDSWKVPPDMGTTLTTKGPTNPYSPTSGTTQTAPPSTDMNECDPNMVRGDLIFLLDMSCTAYDKNECPGLGTGYTPADNLENLKQFLLHIADSVAIGANNVRLGVVTYSRGGVKATDPYSSREEFENFVRNTLPTLASASNWHQLSAGLEKVKEGFNERPSPKYNYLATGLVVIPNGVYPPDESSDPKLLSDELKAMPVVIAGIAPSKNFAVANVLKAMITGSSDMFYSTNYTYFKQVNTYQGLKTAYTVAYGAACAMTSPLTTKPPLTESSTSSVSTSTVTTAAPVTGCHYLDLVFIIDESQSLTGQGWADIKDFLKRFAKTIGPQYIRQQFIRIAMVGFASKAQLEFNLGDITSFGDFEKKIDELNRLNGLTYTTKAFKLAKSDIFDNPRSGRRGGSTPSTIIFLTDGNYDEDESKENPAVPAESIRDTYHTTILSVAIQGQNTIDKDELIMISGTEANVFTSNGTGDLVNLIDRLINASCKPSICPADIAFLVETSELVTAPGVNETLDRVLNVTNEINKGENKENGVRIGLVSFSYPERTAIRVQFKDDNPTSLIENLKTQWKTIRGLSDLGKGIKVSETLLRLSSTNGENIYGSRPDVLKFLVIMAQGFQDTEGISGDWPDPKAQAVDLRRYVPGLRIYAVEVPPDAAVFPNTGDTCKPSAVGNNFEIDDSTLLNIVGGYRNRTFCFNQFYQIADRINYILEHSDCSPPPPPPLETCEQYMDVVFLFHLLSNVSEENNLRLGNMTEFLGLLAAGFGIDSGYTNLAVVTYASKANVQFGLNLYHSNSRVQAWFKDAVKVRALDTAQSSEGIGGLAEAFTIIDLDVFNGMDGDRPDSLAPNTIIMVTDNLTYTDDEFKPILDAAKRLKEMDVLIQVVTIGENTTMGGAIDVAQARELAADVWVHTQDPLYDKDMAPGPVPADWTLHDFNFPNFGDISDPDVYKDIIDNVTEAACNNKFTLSLIPQWTRTVSPYYTTTTPFVTRKPLECHFLDLVFIIDESQSLTGHGFQDIKDFLKTFADELGPEYITQDYIHISVIGFADDARVEIYLDQVSSAESFKKEVDDISRMNGLTFTATAFWKAKNDVLIASRGWRQGRVPSAIILVTDGNYNTEQGNPLKGDPRVPAKQLLNDGQVDKIISVAVLGQQHVDFSFLDDISGKSNVYTVNGTSNLKGVINQLINSSCEHNCPGDVAFLLETSELVTAAGVNASVDRIRKMINNLSPSIGVKESKNSRVGLVSFSYPSCTTASCDYGTHNRTEIRISFEDGQNSDTVNKDLDWIENNWQHVRGLSDLGWGLRKTRTLFSDPKYGSRQTKPKFLVVFAQGFQDTEGPPKDNPTQWPDPKTEAQNLKDMVSGIEIFAVAVPPDASLVNNPEDTCTPQTFGNSFHIVMDTLSSITGSRDRVYCFNEYAKINDRINTILKNKMDCYAPPVQSDRVIDLVMVLDSSRSLVDYPSYLAEATTTNAYIAIKNFAMRMVREPFTFDKDATLVSVITYAKEPVTIFELGNSTKADDMAAMINDADWLGAGDKAYDYVKDVAKALRAAREEIENRGRKDVAQPVVLLLLDGLQTLGTEDPMVEAQKLMDMNATILALGSTHWGSNPTQNCLLLKNLTGAENPRYADCSPESSPAFQVNGWLNAPDEASNIFKVMPVHVKPSTSTASSTTSMSTASSTTSMSTSTTTVKPVTGNCANLDVALLVDISKRVLQTGNNMAMEKKFFSDLVHLFDIAADKTHVGLVTMDTQAKTQSDFTKTFDITSIDHLAISALMGLDLTSGIKKLSSTGLIGDATADRPTSGDVAVIFVSQDPMNSAGAVAASGDLKNAGKPSPTTVILVAAQGVDTTQFHSIASTGYFYQLPDWTEASVTDVVSKIKAKLCTTTAMSSGGGPSFAVQSLPVSEQLLISHPVASGETCAEGYAGPNCDRPICTEKGTVTEADKEPKIIEISSHTDCNAVKIFPVDSHTSKLYIKVVSKDDGQPSIVLTGPDGKKIETLNIVTQTSAQLSVAVDDAKPGYYKADFTAKQTCTFTASAESTLSLSVGFSASATSDSVTAELSAHQLSYLLVHVHGLEYPAEVLGMQLYQDGELELQREAVRRYNCAFENSFGRVGCDALKSTVYKVYGIDERGYAWERSSELTCTAK